MFAAACGSVDGGAKRAASTGEGDGDGSSRESTVADRASGKRRYSSRSFCALFSCSSMRLLLEATDPPPLRANEAF
jgi:hypothetical protein